MVIFFITIDDYEFDSTTNLLTIKSGSLKYSDNHKYEILVSTIHFNTEYSQKVRISMTKAKYAPVVLLKYFKKVLL